jgi:hypothetical protein
MVMRIVGELETIPPLLIEDLGKGKTFSLRWRDSAGIHREGALLVETLEHQGLNTQVVGQVTLKSGGQYKAQVTVLGKTAGRITYSTDEGK